MKILFKDGTIFPLNGNDKSYKFFVIENNKVIYLNNKYPDFKVDKIISIKNKFIYPTLTDSHLHLLYSIVLSASSFDICKVNGNEIYPNNLKDIEKEIRSYVEKNSNNNLIIVNQYISPAIKEKRLPNKNELDLWCNGKDVVVFCIDGHSASLSSSMLQKLNIESEDGILSGSKYDLNQGLITGYVAKSVNLKLLLKGIVNFTNTCLKYGITKVCALDGEEGSKENDLLFKLLVFIARRMDIDVKLFPQYHDFNVLNKLKNKMNSKRIGGCSKWELDGSVGSFSASFENKYKEKNIVSNLYYEDDYVCKKVKEALEKNITFTCHAIGTKAIDQIVNAYEKNKKIIPSCGPYPRIDHFEFPTKEAIDFVSKYRIAVTIQPGYSYIDKYYIHSYKNHLNEKDLNNLVSLKTLVDKGICILGSSDSPVQSINPFDQMFGMVNYYNEKESISNYDALKSYTTNPSIALDEDEGRLFINGKANFIISKNNILEMNKNKINQIEIDEVYKNGKKEFSKKANLFYLLKILFRIPHKI